MVDIIFPLKISLVDKPPILHLSDADKFQAQNLLLLSPKKSSKHCGNDLIKSMYMIMQKKAHATLRCHPSYSAAFTGGFVVTNESNVQLGSACDFSCYNDTTGKGHTTFTGADIFFTSEIEVYSVV